MSFFLGALVEIPCWSTPFLINKVSSAIGMTSSWVVTRFFLDAGSLFALSKEAIQFGAIAFFSDFISRAIAFASFALSLILSAHLPPWPYIHNLGGGGPSSSRVSFLRLQFGRRWSIVLQGFIFVITVGEEVAPPPTWFLFYIYSLGTLVLVLRGFLFIFTVWVGFKRILETFPL